MYGWCMTSLEPCQKERRRLLIDRAMSAWSKLPDGGKAACFAVALLILAPAIRLSVEEGSLSTLWEFPLALILHSGIIFGSFFGAAWVGIKITERTARWWLGWAVGLFIFASGVVMHNAMDNLPIIGWRMEKMIEDGDCYRDWDGRSNPLVCK